MTKLIFIDEKFGGRVYEFVVPETTVGRGDHNMLTIRDASVSLTHCEILAYGPEVIVRDLGSSNGTFVNGERLHNQQRQLKAGQVVKFGLVEARLELEKAYSSDTASGMTAIHSYARYLREQQNKPKKLRTPFMTLESGSEPALADHTVVLSRPPDAKETIVPPVPEKVRGPEKPSNRMAIALLAAALALGLVVLLWLLWGTG